MLFINLDTGEYPRFAGDVSLSPDANWALVVPSPKPESAPPLGHSWFEAYPLLLEDGTYLQNWGLIKSPEHIIRGPEE